MKPAFKITADKKDVTDLISQRLISINITDETGLVSDTCEILLDNRDNVLEIPTLGANLEICLGYEDTPLTKMGDYIVDDVEVSAFPSQMRITGKATNTQLKDLNKKIKAPRSRSWHKYTLVGIITTIASEHNFEAVIDEYFKQIYISHLDQTDESDISFLNSLASDYGAFVKIASGISGAPVMPLASSRSSISTFNSDNFVIYSSVIFFSFKLSIDDLSLKNLR